MPLPPSSQDSLLQLRQDFHSESEDEESEGSEGSKGSEEDIRELDIAPLNEHLDQEYGLPIRRELAEDEEN